MRNDLDAAWAIVYGVVCCVGVVLLWIVYA
jgi:hypothetical protein